MIRLMVSLLISCLTLAGTPPKRVKGSKPLPPVVTKLEGLTLYFQFPRSWSSSQHLVLLKSVSEGKLCIQRWDSMNRTATQSALFTISISSTPTCLISYYPVHLSPNGTSLLYYGDDPAKQQAGWQLVRVTPAVSHERTIPSPIARFPRPSVFPRAVWFPDSIHWLEYSVEDMTLRIRIHDVSNDQVRELTAQSKNGVRIQPTSLPAGVTPDGRFLLVSPDARYLHTVDLNASVPKYHSSQVQGLHYQLDSEFSQVYKLVPPLLGVTLTLQGDKLLWSVRTCVKPQAPELLARPEEATEGLEWIAFFQSRADGSNMRCIGAYYNEWGLAGYSMMGDSIITDHLAGIWLPNGRAFSFHQDESEYKVELSGE